MVGTAFLAHQGGWDEFLLVLGPIAVIAAALAVAKRRVDTQANERDAAETDQALQPRGSEGHDT